MLSRHRDEPHWLIEKLPLGLFFFLPHNNGTNHLKRHEAKSLKRHRHYTALYPDRPGKTAPKHRAVIPFFIFLQRVTLTTVRPGAAASPDNGWPQYH